ncbi:MAG: DnaD domain protein [Monoglobaceae bacterium]
MKKSTSCVRESNFITIQGFMLSRLKLKGAELLTYAIIYGFSQSEGQYFRGSLKYLAEWTNSTVRSVTNYLNRLKDKGLIYPVKNADGERIGYRAVFANALSERNSHTEKISIEQSSHMEQSSIEQSSPMEYSSIENNSPMEQSSCMDRTNFHEVWNKIPEGIEKNSTDNIDNNIIYYNNINNKHTHKSFDCFKKNIGHLTPAVKNEICDYLDQGIADDMICEAIKDAAKAQKLSWNYINAIIVDKLKRNITTYDAYIDDKDSFRQQRNAEKVSDSYPSETDLYEEYIPSDEDRAAYFACKESQNCTPW